MVEFDGFKLCFYSMNFFKKYFKTKIILTLISIPVQYVLLAGCFGGGLDYFCTAIPLVWMFDYGELGIGGLREFSYYWLILLSWVLIWTVIFTYLGMCVIFEIAERAVKIYRKK